ncbi:MAG: hypothetical protein JWQ97_213, partial [Phenylobacterium sp.]|nr:hypothetical protein [Phenylobacterium sp.]
MQTAKAAVLVADRTIEIRELPVPAPPPGGAILAVEGCGMCGSDIKQYAGETARSGIGRLPCIPGHETVGRIASIDPEGARRWGLKEGDRVAVHGVAPCGACPACMRGDACMDAFYYGYRSLDVGSGLWGGFSEAMEIVPRTRLYPVSERLPIEDALLFNPLAAGYDWIFALGELKLGETVLILGGGQRGLAAVIAAVEGGASQIIVTGLASDAFKLEIARKLGATCTLIVEESDVPAKVLELTGGRGADLVLDTTPMSFAPVRDAIKAARRGGRIVFSGLKGPKPMPDFPFDAVVMRQLKMIGALSSGHWAIQQAIRAIEGGRFPLHLLHTHTEPIEKLGRAIEMLAGEIPGE